MLMVAGCNSRACLTWLSEHSQGELGGGGTAHHVCFFVVKFFFALGSDTPLHPTYMAQPEPCPWAPFENLVDFEYKEMAVLGLLPKWIINKQLAGLNSNWAEGS